MNPNELNKQRKSSLILPFKMLKFCNWFLRPHSNRSKLHLTLHSLKLQLIVTRQWRSDKLLTHVSHTLFMTDRCDLWVLKLLEFVSSLMLHLLNLLTLKGNIEKWKTQVRFRLKQLCTISPSLCATKYTKSIRFTSFVSNSSRIWKITCRLMLSNFACRLFWLVTNPTGFFERNSLPKCVTFLVYICR